MGDYINDIKTILFEYLKNEYKNYLNNNNMLCIKKSNISEIATSFADSSLIDRRFTYNSGGRKLIANILGMYPLSSIFNSQVALTQYYFDKSVLARSMFANHSEEIKHLLTDFSIPDHSNKGGSKDFSQINGNSISNHYIDLLHQHKLLSQHIDFTQANSFFEIGGGFGVNIHLLITNYPNIKKFILLSILY